MVVEWIIDLLEPTVNIRHIQTIKITQNNTDIKILAGRKPTAGRKLTEGHKHLGMSSKVLVVGSSMNRT